MLLRTFLIKNVFKCSYSNFLNGRPQWKYQLQSAMPTLPRKCMNMYCSSYASFLIYRKKYSTSTDLQKEPSEAALSGITADFSTFIPDIHEKYPALTSNFSILQNCNHHTEKQDRSGLNQCRENPLASIVTPALTSHLHIFLKLVVRTEASIQSE